MNKRLTGIGIFIFLIVFIIGITLFFLYPLGLHKIFGDYVVFNSELMRTTGSSVSENVIGLKDLFIKTNNYKICG